MSKPTIFDYAREATLVEKKLLDLLDPEQKDDVEDEASMGEVEVDVVNSVSVDS